MSTLQNISVIVVGAGFAGLAVAIELRLRGAEVKVFEAVKNFSRQGEASMKDENRASGGQMSLMFSGYRRCHFHASKWRPYHLEMGQFIRIIHQKFLRLQICRHS